MTARDPVCGMSVDMTTAYSEAVGGQTYYFCSENCRQRFDEDPGSFTAGSASFGDGLEQHEPPHTTSGGITSPKFGSAGSGGAEYERLPEQHDGRNNGR
jgi:Cu+-exporting ATPase